MLNKISIIFGVLFLCGCATVYNPATGKNEFILIDTKSEVSLGKSLNQQIRKEFKVPDNPQLNNRLKNIGEKIAKVSDRQDLDYQFGVIEDKGLNAFSIPGGYVYVNTGLLNIANDDELAAVVGHEIGHVAARHSVKKLQTALGYEIIMSIAFSKTNSLDAAKALDVVFNLISLGYSRDDERLADKLGLKYAFKAGFNPRGMITLLHKLEEDAKKQGGNYHLIFLDSHPPLEERINNMNKEIDNLEHPSAGVTVTSAKPQLSGPQPPSKTVEPRNNLDNTKLNTSKVAKTKRICPVCKRVYSYKYNFCPYDGASLVSKK